MVVHNCRFVVVAEGARCRPHTFGGIPSALPGAGISSRHHSPRALNGVAIRGKSRGRHVATPAGLWSEYNEY